MEDQPGRIQVLTLGRDALRYMENIRKLNKEITEAIGSQPHDQLKDIFEELKTERDSLSANIDILRRSRKNIKAIYQKRKSLKTREEIKENDSAIQAERKNANLAYQNCLKDLNRIKTLYTAVKRTTDRVWSSLTGVKQGIAEEIKELEQIGRELAGMEGKINEMERNENAAVNRLSKLLKRDLRKTAKRLRREERRDSKLIKVLDNTMDAVEEILKTLSNTVKPNVEQGKILAESFGPATYEKLRSRMVGERRASYPEVSRKMIGGDYDYVADFFQRYLETINSTVLLKIVTGAVDRIANLEKIITRSVSGMDDKLKNFEANHGTVMAPLKRAIRTMENTGMVKKGS